VTSRRSLALLWLWAATSSWGGEEKKKEKKERKKKKGRANFITKTWLHKKLFLLIESGKVNLTPVWECIRKYSSVLC
jgi:hypothetical protein